MIFVEPLWAPDKKRQQASQLRAFIDTVNAGFELQLDDYATLHRWSVEHPALFWPAVARFTDVRFDRECDDVLIDGDRMPGAQWFNGARLNFAANLLRYRDGKPALVFRDETGRRETLTYAELYRQVAAVAGGMRAHGVTSGDRIAALMPNHPQTVVAMLAATSLGAVFSSCSPDFGVNGVLDRFGQIEPKLLFAADGYYYGGKRIGTLATVADITGQIDSITTTVIVPNLSARPDIGKLTNAVLIDEFKSNERHVDFDPLPFDHPLYVMYSSGTTGVPKCIVHGAGGTLIQHLKEHALHVDLRRGDVFFYFTTCGWMMWNWLVSGLASGATLVLYDGSPFHPDPGSLWRLIDEEQISIFGVGAKYIASVEKADYRPRENCALNSLRTILSTGSPLAPESFDFVYRDVKHDVNLASISGGTDLLSCFALGQPFAPVYPGELQCLGLGMAVDVFDDDGRSLPPGEKGELVCTRPFPSMPLGFWNDEDGSRYRAAYFERFDDVWTHGDYVELTAHGGLIIHGRSDAVLNPGGVRIGTAEIYRQVEKMPQVIESIAIGQRWKDDTRVVLFVVLRPGAALDDDLRQKIRQTIRDNATPRHVPAKIIAVPEIPRTISGKIVELAVRSVVHGEAVRNTDALANPVALEFFRDIEELQSD